MGSPRAAAGGKKLPGHILLVPRAPDPARPSTVPAVGFVRKPVIAVDSVDAGGGDLVLVSDEGNARWDPDEIPAQEVIQHRRLDLYSGAGAAQGGRPVVEDSWRVAADEDDLVDSAHDSSFDSNDIDRSLTMLDAIESMKGAFVELSA
jgi:hypothetical protein